MQEIVGLKFDPGLDVGRYLLIERGPKLRKILDSELHVRERPSSGGRVMSTRSTNLRDVRILEP